MSTPFSLTVVEDLWGVLAHWSSKGIEGVVPLKFLGEVLLNYNEFLVWFDMEFRAWPPWSSSFLWIKSRKLSNLVFGVMLEVSL